MKILPDFFKKPKEIVKNYETVETKKIEKLQKINSLQKQTIDNLTKINSYNTNDYINSFLPNTDNSGDSNSKVQSIELLGKKSRTVPTFAKHQDILNAYSSIGLAKNIIDTPVDDAYVDDFIIESPQLSTDDIKEFQKFLTEKRVKEKYCNSIKWARAFSGGGLVFLFSNKTLKEEFKIEKNHDFELIDDWLWSFNLDHKEESFLSNSKQIYMWNSSKIHPTKAIAFQGLPTVGFKKVQTNGWGLSIFDRTISGLNLLNSIRDLYLELSEQQTYDVLKVPELSTSLANSQTQAKLAQKMGFFNKLKSAFKTIVLDDTQNLERLQVSLDGFEKSFMTSARIIAAECRMPISKLFGSEGGQMFNSGKNEGDEKNYINLMEGEIRQSYFPQLKELLEKCCIAFFGFLPSDFNVKLSPLFLENPIEIEEKKIKQSQRVFELLDRGLIDEKKAKEMIDTLKLDS